MQRNSVISLRPAPWAWQRLGGSAGADPQAAYGCVDWYLYQEKSCGPRAAPHDPPASLIERAAAIIAATAARTALPGDELSARSAG